MRNVSILEGVVCYNGTTAESTAVYICNNITQGNEVTRVCQSDGTWNGTISSCPGIIGHTEKQEMEKQKMKIQWKLETETEKRKHRMMHVLLAFIPRHPRAPPTSSF